MLKNNVITKKIDIVFILLMSIFLSACLFVATACNTDDAGTYLWAYRMYEIGSGNYSFMDLIKPWNLTTSFLYFCGIGNTGSEMVLYCYAIWYFICVFMTLTLAMKEAKNKWLLFLAVFMLLPYEATNKYHLVPAAVAFLVIYGIYDMVITKKKKIFLFSIVMFIYFFITIDDRLILLLFVAVPVALYGAIWYLQNADKKKLLYLGSLGAGIIVALIKMIDVISRQVSGKGIALLEAWGGYGGDSYLTWINAYDFFDKGIPSVLSSLLIQYNIPAEGGMIQFSSFFWIIRLVLVGIMVVAFISRWKDIIKNGIVNVNVLDAICVISVTALLGINVLNGMVAPYELEDAPINRYASLAWFLLIINFIRWIDEKHQSNVMFVFGKREITSGIVLGLTFILLTVGYSEPIHLGRNMITQEQCQGELDYLKSRGDSYKCGIASFWKSYPITAMTNGEYIAHPGWIAEDKKDPDRLYFEPKYDGIYDDGSNYFNYIIWYKQNGSSISEERINAIRGDYVEQKGLPNGESIIYMYDYDVRFEPKLIMEAVGTDYELVDPIEYHFDFPVGINRIEMTVINSANFELEIVDNPDVQNVTINKLNDNKIQVDIVCLQNTKVTFKVARKADELTTIHKIMLKRVKAAVTVWEDGQEDVDEVFLNAGSYVFTFIGENLEELQVDWSGTSIESEQLTNGKIRRKYQIDVDVPQNIQYTVVGDGINLEKVSYENAVLFEEE